MIDIKKLKELQHKVAEQVILDSKTDIGSVKKVAGFDVIFNAKKYMIWKEIIIEKKFHSDKEPMFFMPTLLAFREGPAIIRTFELFENKPDVLMIDGDGILHPYGCW